MSSNNGPYRIFTLDDAALYCARRRGVAQAIVVRVVLARGLDFRHVVAVTFKWWVPRFSRAKRIAAFSREIGSRLASPGLSVVLMQSDAVDRIVRGIEDSARRRDAYVYGEDVSARTSQGHAGMRRGHF